MVEMQTVKLGKKGPDVSRVGLGCMGMSEFYGPGDDNESLRVIDRALELGVNFLDTADVYGPHKNEFLVGKALQGRRDEFVLATKFGIVRDPNDPMKRGICGRPEYVMSCCDASLKRLGVDTIDLYYQHRVDTDTPIEDTVGAMSRLVEQGKVREPEQGPPVTPGAPPLAPARHGVLDEIGPLADSRDLTWSSQGINRRSGPARGVA